LRPNGSVNHYLRPRDKPLIERRRTGEYSNPAEVRQKLVSYDRIRRERLKVSKYADVAYVDGYQNGLLSLLASAEQRKQLPLITFMGRHNILKHSEGSRGLCAVRLLSTKKHFALAAESSPKESEVPTSLFITHHSYFDQW